MASCYANTDSITFCSQAVARVLGAAAGQPAPQVAALLHASRLQTAAQAGERIPFVRAQAGDRAADLELNVLIQAVVVTRYRRAAAEQLVAERRLSLSAAEALETPFLLIGTESEIAGQLRERRDRFGFSYVTVHEPYMADLLR